MPNNLWINAITVAPMTGIFPALSLAKILTEFWSKLSIRFTLEKASMRIELFANKESVGKLKYFDLLFKIHTLVEQWHYAEYIKAKLKRNEYVFAFLCRIWIYFQNNNITCIHWKRLWRQQEFLEPKLNQDKLSRCKTKHRPRSVRTGKSGQCWKDEKL